PIRDGADVLNALAQLVGRHAQTGHDAEPARARHLGGELGPGGAAHARLHDRVFDAQQLAERRAQAHRPKSFSACSRSFTRCTLSPCGLGVRGTSPTKRTPRGILNDAILPWHQPRSSSSVSAAPGLRITYATGASFVFGSGMPTTKACATAACASKNASISPGATM